MRIGIFICVLLTGLAVFGQNTKDMYVPREYRQAYDNETRSIEGVPGDKYFQNTAHYNIDVEFFPDTKTLVGSEKILYTNNSADTLSRVYVNVYQNLYKKGEARDANIDPRNIHDGVKISHIKVNGIEIDTNSFFYYSTLLTFKTPKMSPGSISEIEIAWKQRMPVTAQRRIGTYDESNFFIGYWYPQINVYDDIVGWNKFGHTGNAEFYNDFADFDVNITVPSEYNVWSSGLLQNAKDIFRRKYFKRIQKAAKSNDIIHVISISDRDQNQITRTANKHTWKFKAENLTDFAFAVSNKYLWDATSIKIGDERVLINSVYNPKSENFRDVAELSQKSIKYFSEIDPAIPYPFPILTAFNGEVKGVEFPAMINDQEEDKVSSIYTTTHEIAHSYFPFYVETNEQEYGWIDEGLVTIIGFSAFMEFAEMNEETLKKLVAGKYKEQSGKLGIDIPLMTGTHHAGDFTYGFMTYVRSSTAFYLLRNYIGAENFSEAIRQFADVWKGKHPIPYDLFYTFNDVAGEDLAWFWEPWFFELGYADIGIGTIQKNADNTIVTIENHGSFPVPIELTVTYKDGSTKTISKRMDVWKSGAETVEVIIPKGELSKLSLGSDTPDTFNDNDEIVFSN